jgi:hypothetical protein
MSAPITTYPAGPVTAKSTRSANDPWGPPHRHLLPSKNGGNGRQPWKGSWTRADVRNGVTRRNIGHSDVKIRNFLPNYFNALHEFAKFFRNFAARRFPIQPQRTDVPFSDTKQRRS